MGVPKGSGDVAHFSALGTKIHVNINDPRIELTHLFLNSAANSAYQFSRTNSGILNFSNNSAVAPSISIQNGPPTLGVQFGTAKTRLPITIRSPSQHPLTIGPVMGSWELNTMISGTEATVAIRTTPASILLLNSTGTWTGSVHPSQGGTILSGSGTIRCLDTAFPVSSTLAQGVYVSQEVHLRIEAPGSSYFLNAGISPLDIPKISQAPGVNFTVSGLNATGGAKPTLILDSETGSEFLIQLATSSYEGRITGGIQSASFDSHSGSRVSIGFSAKQTFSGNNDYLCRTFVFNGSSLDIEGNSALGASTEAGGSPVFVKGGGSLISHGATIDKDILLNGTGIHNTGALQGTGTVSGTVTLGWSDGIERTEISEMSIAPSIHVSEGVLSFTGKVTGSQPLIKIGPGTLQLLPKSDHNTFSAIPLVSDGVLEGNTAGLPTSIINNATVQFTQTVPGTYPHVIAGQGNVIKEGKDKLILSGANTYSGGTSVCAGILEGTTESLQGPISNYGIVAFNQRVEGTYASTISGPGDLTIDSSSGTTAILFTDTHSYSGSTTINRAATANRPVLRMGITNAISNSSAVIVNENGIFDLNHFNQNINNLSGRGNVVLGTAILSINSTSENSFSGVISGSGGITKLGSYSLILNSANKYTGATSVDEGTLHIQTADGIAQSSGLIINRDCNVLFHDFNQHIKDLAGSGNIKLGCLETTQFFINPTSGLTTFSGIISGAGSLCKSGGNILVLSGANSYTGNTIIEQNGGTLRAGIINAIQNSSGLVINSGGTFDLNHYNQDIHDLLGSGNIVLGKATLSVNPVSSRSFFAGNISGSGGLTKWGANTLVLGTNSYTGPTFISNGILCAGMENSIASSSGLMINKEGIFDLNHIAQSIQDLAGSGKILLGYATLAVNPVSPLTKFSGSISGHGGLTKTGTNTLVLIGTNSYLGKTTVSAGTLIGNTSSIPGDIENDGNVIFNQESPGVYTGTLSGNGLFTKRGNETLTFDSTAHTQKKIAVESGTLRMINTTVTSPVTVSAGASLKGTGVIKGVTVVSGTLSPGNSIGVIQGDPSFTLAKGSTLALEVNGMQSSKVVASGAFTIQPQSTLKIEPVATLPPLAQYTIVLASPVSGTFSQVTVTSNLYIPEVTYFSDHILLSLTLDASEFVTIPVTGNAGTLLPVLSGLDPTSSACITNLFNSLNPLSVTKFANELNQLHPALFNAFAISQESCTIALRETITQHLEDQRYKCEDVYFCPGPDLWITPFGDFLNQQFLGHAPGFSTYSAGIVLGGDYQILPKATVGASLSYSHSELFIGEGAAAQGKGHINTGYLVLYGSTWKRHFFLDLALLGSVDFFSGSRHVEFSSEIASLDENPHHNNTGYEGSAHLALGFPLGPSGKLGDAWCTPYAMADYIFIHETSYKESKGDCINLKVRAKNSDLLRAEEGLRLSACKIFSTITMVPEIRLATAQEWRFSGKKTTARFKVGDVDFTVDGMLPDRVLFVPGFALSTYFFNQQAICTARFDTEIAHKYWDVKVQIEYSQRF